MRHHFVRAPLAALLLLTLSAPLVAQTQQTTSPNEYTAIYVVEPTTWTVLRQENAQTPLPPASMTKMMTLLLTIEAQRKGRVKWQTPVTTSREASVLGGSQVYLKQGEQFTVAEMAAATMVHSANDAAQALAEKIGGSREAFVTMMNARAQQLGLKNTKFVSPHGLPQGEGLTDDMMSAEDLARLGWELMKYPEMRDWAMRKTMPFRNGTFTMYNPNRLVRNDFPGVIGIKTGYHGAAGFCVTAAAHRDGMTIVAVVMGGPSARVTENVAGRLMSEAFAQWEFREPVRQGQPVNGLARVQNGQAEAVNVIAGKSARFLVPINKEPKFDVTVAGANVEAPVKRGQQVGTILIRRDGQPVAKVPALAASDVEKNPWWKAFWPF